MIRKDAMIREDQDKFISKLPGTFSEHLRKALDLYIESKKPTASASPSAKGGQNG